MADRGGPAYGEEPGGRERPGGAEPMRPRPYRHDAHGGPGGPAEERHTAPGQGGRAGQGGQGHAPFDYFTPSGDQLGPVAPGGLPGAPGPGGPAGRGPGGAPGMQPPRYDARPGPAADAEPDTLVNPAVDGGDGRWRGPSPADPGGAYGAAARQPLPPEQAQAPYAPPGGYPPQPPGSRGPVPQGPGAYGPAPHEPVPRDPAPHEPVPQGPGPYGSAPREPVPRDPAPYDDAFRPFGDEQEPPPPPEQDEEGYDTGRSRLITAPLGGRAERRRTAKRIRRRRRLSATKEIPILIVVALLIALVLKTFLVQAFVIPSGSMEETIRIGDRVLVDKLTPWFGSKPKRGDVVVFKDPGGWLDPAEAPQQDAPAGVKQVKDALTFIGLLPSADEQDLIKRVVALGGDEVRCCDRQGRVTVNGTPLDEPYLHPGNKPSRITFDVHVPVGRMFVMGDHRANSADSRYHLDGPGRGTVPESMVVGRAVVIAWPFDHWRRLEEPKTFASVPQARGAAPAAPGTGGDRVAQLDQLASPAELPLVMGVVGLSRMRGGRQWSVRRDSGGLGGRHPYRFGRRRRRRRWRRPGARAS